jgi:ubiquinone/menaquinone biosynthesis C-methylase UbiE
MTGDFDLYKNRYEREVQKSIGFVHQDLSFFTQAKVRHILDLAGRRLGDPAALDVLDVGCGAGVTDVSLTPRFRSLHGVDISEGLLDDARLANPGGTYCSYDGRQLPFLEARFDLTFAICVLHHVSPPQWQAFVQEMARVTRAGGLVAVFEHNPMNPLTRLAVSRCEFDEDAVLLGRRVTEKLLSGAGLGAAESRYILFFPWAVPFAERIEGAVKRLPLGAQYFVAAQKP